MFIDLHIYTDLYSELGVLPIGHIQQAIDNGIDGVVLVEKNRLWTDEDIRLLRKGANVPESFLIFKGQEIETPDGNIIIIGCNEELSNQSSTLQLKQKIKQSGGCTILIPQKPRQNDNFYTLIGHKKNLTANFNNFDAVEIYNSKLDRKLMRTFLDFSRKKHICRVAGSASSQESRYATKFFENVKTEKDIAKAILNRHVSPVFIDDLPVDPKGGSTKCIDWNIPKVSIMNVKGLIFDLYGTLIELKSNESYEEFNKMALWMSQENIQVSGESLMNYYRQRCNELYDNALKAVKFPEVDILQVFRDAIKLFSGEDRGAEFAKKSALVFRTLTVKQIKLYPYTRSVLRELKRKKYRMGIISNAQAAFTIPELQDLKLYEFFDFIILSSDVGCSKPDSKIYEIASRQIELYPHETAFIGDDLIGDIYGAQKNGFKTVFVNTHVGTSDHPAIPDVTLKDGDIRNLLRIFP